MTTAARVLAYVLGLALVAGLVVLAVAGVTAATAVLVTAAAVVAMIALGGIMGGRSTPNREPVPLHGADPPPTGPGEHGAPGEGDGGGTMEE
ncbi:MAG: hypothetical protein ACYDA2_00210 [Acidimicrobiales bacterium]